ncbi:hypothetical protein ACFWSJ_15815 [Streptomyces niveus]|uniref:hypothetical protein n=1 Tax=Streptomyces niveus TaxID=193462 RepID=UPI003646F32A
MEPGDQSSGSDSYVGVTGIRSYDGRHRHPRATLHSSPEVSLPPTPAPRRGSVDTVNFYDLETGEAFTADRNQRGNWFVRKWNGATDWPEEKRSTTLRFIAAVGPELVAAIGKGFQAAGYDKTGKIITATGAVTRGVLDSVGAWDSGEVNKMLTATGGFAGAVAQFPTLSAGTQAGLEAFALTSSTGGRAVNAWQEPTQEPAPEPFHTSLPLNTQISTYANASPDSLSPTPETPIGGGSGSDFEPPQPLRRRTTRLEGGQSVNPLTSMLPPGQEERARRNAPPLARTSSMQVPPADRNRSAGSGASKRSN